MGVTVEAVPIQLEERKKPTYSHINPHVNRLAIYILSDSIKLFSRCVREF